MLRNVVVHNLKFFYPLGNTPAVCLTQDLPPEQDANILLLGCGDARNILYTAYADAEVGLLLPALYQYAALSNAAREQLNDVVLISPAVTSSRQCLVSQRKSCTSKSLTMLKESSEHSVVHLPHRLH